MRPYSLHLGEPFYGEVVKIDLDRPLKEQLSGEKLKAAETMLEMLRKSTAMHTA